jgi:hypothetical protein
LVYLASGLFGVLRSSDGGATWASSAPGLDGPAVFGVAASGSTLYAATNGAGVFDNLTGGN